MSSDEIVIDVRNISKRYEIYANPRDRLKQLTLPRLYQAGKRVADALGIGKQSAPPSYFREFWALRNVSFQVRRGETLGIIGRNGSGKSTLLQILAGTLAPTSGEAVVQGRIAALLELGSGFNPEFSGRENVFLNGRILGLSQKEVRERYDQIVEFADIGEFIDEPVKTYSSGMFLRLAFAVQAHIDASIVIIDEALAVGDIFFRQKCYTRLEQLKAAGAAILLVSHSMPDIEQYCERAILLDHGNARFLGASSEAAKHYYQLHNNQLAQHSPLGPAIAELSFNTQSNATIDLPPPEAFLNLTGKAQVSNGQAHCTGVALCNEAGQPSNNFRQGDTAVFYFEFELNENIGVPICGIIIKNERGVIVHGKNSWQYEGDAPRSLGPGSRILCRQEVKLDIGPGEYVFETGLTWVTTQQWENRLRISHEEMSALYISACEVPNVGVFSVGLAMRNGVATLTHHGIADLPGTMEIAATAKRETYEHT
jgi:lipopolysaccharide transport system ATP-binding protein